MLLLLCSAPRRVHDFSRELLCCLSNDESNELSSSKEFVLIHYTYLGKLFPLNFRIVLRCCRALIGLSCRWPSPPSHQPSTALFILHGRSWIRQETLYRVLGCHIFPVSENGKVYRPPGRCGYQHIRRRLFPPRFLQNPLRRLARLRRHVLPALPRGQLASYSFRSNHN